MVVADDKAKASVLFNGNRRTHLMKKPPHTAPTSYLWWREHSILMTENFYPPTHTPPPFAPYMR